MLSFLSFSLIQFMQPRRSAPKKGDNVMMTRDCGRVMAMLYSQLATRLRSLAIILPIHLFTITRVHFCNRIHIITIRMPMKADAGVHALPRVLVIGKYLRRSLCESNCFDEPFHYLKSSLLVLGNILICTGFGLWRILVSTRLGLQQHLGGWCIVTLGWFVEEGCLLAFD